MEPFDICIAYVSWGADGKRRPVLMLAKEGDYAEVFRITTQYEEKSKTIQAQYFKIDDWQQAGLFKQSYVDTTASIEVPIVLITSAIGKFTDNDKRRLLKFLID